MRCWRLVWVTGFMACAGVGKTDETDARVDDTDAHTDTNPDTDVAPATFSDVEVLLNRNCSTIGCHAGPEVETGLDLSDGNAYASLVGVASHQVPTMDRVVPGDPVSSYLMEKLNGTFEGVGGEGDIMPPGFGLSEQDRAVFSSWIAAGALDN